MMNSIKPHAVINAANITAPINDASRGTTLLKVSFSFISLPSNAFLVIMGYIPQTMTSMITDTITATIKPPIIADRVPVIIPGNINAIITPCSTPSKLIITPGTITIGCDRTIPKLSDSVSPTRILGIVFVINIFNI
ncbi:MAG: hypothetical protein MASP_00677 [Candidatus Methanolliviera sp. GoM_asphalt]|nr:MAG: hypothetical protein MASP_00677 [Candidatus Methanolliviera sp. GoM_asphalt]